MSNMFHLKLTNYPHRDKQKLDLEIPKNNQVNFGTKSLQMCVRKAWNSLPYHIKPAENLITFKRIIKSEMEFNVNVQFVITTFSTCRTLVTINRHAFSFYYLSTTFIMYSCRFRLVMYSAFTTYL